MPLLMIYNNPVYPKILLFHIALILINCESREFKLIVVNKENNKTNCCFFWLAEKLNQKASLLSFKKDFVHMNLCFLQPIYPHNIYKFTYFLVSGLRLVGRQ